jgi:hypothetical protein
VFRTILQNGLVQARGGETKSTALEQLLPKRSALFVGFAFPRFSPVTRWFRCPAFGKFFF